MFQSAEEASTRTGVAPTCETASAVAMKVFAGITTSSPGPTSHAIRPSRSASSPLARPTRAPRADERRERVLERGDRRTVDECPRLQRRPHGRNDLVHEWTVLGGEVEKRDTGVIAQLHRGDHPIPKLREST